MALSFLVTTVSVVLKYRFKTAHVLFGHYITLYDQIVRIHNAELLQNYLIIKCCFCYSIGVRSVFISPQTRIVLAKTCIFRHQEMV